MGICSKVLALFLCLLGRLAFGHDGPDPVMHWNFNARSLKDGALAARLGPDVKLSGKFTVAKDEFGESLLMNESSELTVESDFKNALEFLPKRLMTVSAWVAVNQPQQWGAIAGVIQDDGAHEKGWVVGYNQRRFYFGLATEGADDGNGLLTYLESQTQYEVGKLYHLVASYDGEVMRLFVNGQLSGESKTQSGDILYPDEAPFVLGKYLDSNEDHPHIGRIREVAIYDVAAKAAWAKHEFEHQSKLANLPPLGVVPVEFGFAVRPYLQFVTQNSITVMCQSSRAAQAELFVGESVDDLKSVAKSETRQFVQELVAKNLRPETQYFYKFVLQLESERKESEVSTFQTASLFETPYSFVVISDTQSNPEVAGQVAKMAWEQRPNFLLHPGDLVGTGSNDAHWTGEFFPSMQPLISRVAFFPVLGNHEGNARNYYDYVALPEPEYFYKFQYGNAEFFMIDSNRNVDPESEQYRWLESALSKSISTWKFVCHHHPPYSSDENDYGNLWKTNKSTRGDLRVRQLATLYDTYGVDIVWNGHIHSYERTWPIRDNKATDNLGPIYMITGGGGGSLETPGPFKPFFQNNVRRGHHYCMISVNGKRLEFKAFDLKNQLFDTFQVEKD